MCRFLVVRSAEGFDPSPMVDTFRERCRRSAEFQGHGYGLALLASGRWERYRSLTPIWEDSRPLPRKVEVLVVHARSAFRNEGIDVLNNMPFYREDLCFVFNGELRGVRLKATGRIGAEKIFHVILEQGPDLSEALAATDRLVRFRSRYVRAMNVALTDGSAIYAHCRFAERPDYFTLHYRTGELSGVSSEPLDESFRPMANGETRVL
jgi:glutamine amidotransferase